MTLLFCAVIVSAVSFTSTSWQRDNVFAPYTYLVVGCSFGRFLARANVGYTFAKRDSDTFASDAFARYIRSGENVNYSGGFLVAATPRLTLGADVLGRRLMSADEGAMHQVLLQAAG